MLGLLAQVVANAVAIWVATKIVPGVSIESGDLTRSLTSLLVVGAALTVVNAVVKPLIKAFTGCLYLLTLGLLGLLVNALMLSLAGWIAGKVNVRFDPGPFFFSTILAAVVVTIVSVAVTWLIGPDED